MAEIDREPVVSTHLASVGWGLPDDLTEAAAAMVLGEGVGTLEVEFSDGRVYRYEGVPREVKDRIVGSVSPGRTFNQLVKDRYEGVEQ